MNVCYGSLKKQDMAKFFWFVLLVLVIAGCAAQPTARFVVGDVLLQTDFSQAFQWQHYIHPEQKVEFAIENGVYRARAWDGGFMWTIQPPMETDVMIEVEATQLSDYRNNAYGVMCRAAPTDNGNGYYFLISGDGQYTIRRGAVDTVGALIPWTGSGAIQQDKAINRIRVVCLGSYLALYVNDQFVAETHDDYFHRGYTGLSAAVVEGGMSILPSTI